MAELDDALTRIWDTHRDEIDARIATIEAAVVRLGDQTLDEESRAQAGQAAHQLAGTCGTFGFSDASEHARALEQGMNGEPGPADATALAQLVVEMRAALPEAGT